MDGLCLFPSDRIKNEAFATLNTPFLSPPSLSPSGGAQLHESNGDSTGELSLFSPEQLTKKVLLPPHFLSPNINKSRNQVPIGQEDKMGELNLFSPAQLKKEVSVEFPPFLSPRCGKLSPMNDEAGDNSERAKFVMVSSESPRDDDGESRFVFRGNLFAFFFRSSCSHDGYISHRWALFFSNDHFFRRFLAWF